MTKKPHEGTVTDAIRATIAKIPPSELATAKPVRVLSCLENEGYEITASIKTSTSKLLSEARRAAGNVISFDSGTLAAKQDMAMRLVEACEFNFDVVRAEIDRLENFAKRVKGA